MKITRLWIFLNSTAILKLNTDPNLKAFSYHLFLSYQLESH